MGMKSEERSNKILLIWALAEKIGKWDMFIWKLCTRYLDGFNLVDYSSKQCMAMVQLFLLMK
jgi:hypothetical protein